MIASINSTRIVDGLALLATLAIAWGHWRIFRAWWRGLDAHRAGLLDGGLARLRRRSLPSGPRAGQHLEPPS